MRGLKNLYDDLRLRLQGRSARAQFRRELERFNCGEQSDAAWVDRAEIAAGLIAKTVRQDAVLHIADVGCGDQKLKTILLRRGFELAYQGYDLVPQHENVLKFDIDMDDLPVCDTAVVLGVLEYSADIAKPLAMLSKRSRFLVVSHAVSDERKMTASSLAKLNWKTHLSKKEFERAVTGNGFKLLESAVTSNRKSVVWLCESLQG